MTTKKKTVKKRSAKIDSTPTKSELNAALKKVGYKLPKGYEIAKRKRA